MKSLSNPIPVTQKPSCRLSKHCLSWLEYLQSPWTWWPAVPGPGSFTSLRIGMATAKGIARGTECAIKTIPTLPLLAAGREHWPGIVISVIDARKNHIYAAAFQNGQYIINDRDVSLDDFFNDLPTNQKILVTGPGALLVENYSSQIVIDPLYNSPRGRSMIAMAAKLFETEGGDLPDIGPLYLRNPITASCKPETS